MMDTLSIPPEVLQKYIDKFSPRQFQIIEHVASGATDKETATILSINSRTVRSHITNARKKIGAESRIQLVAVFIAWKYSSLTLHEKSV